MKILTRDFTPREKLLLGVLLIIIIVAAYYLFVYKTVDEQIKAQTAERESLESQLAIATAQVERIQAMSEQMNNDTLRSYMPSYNSSQKELDFLNSTLAETENYLVNFTYITRSGDQITRGFILQFTAKNYAQAEKIIKTLEDSEIRCLIGDYMVSPLESEKNIYNDKVQVSLKGSFYETMYDGIVDKELPADEKAEQ